MCAKRSLWLVHQSENGSSNEASPPTLRFLLVGLRRSFVTVTDRVKLYRFIAMNGDLSLLETVRFVVFDFDGVFTDNRVLVGQDGSEYVFCCRSDGLGLEALVRAGIPALVLSTEVNPIVLARTSKLKLECIHGCSDKWPELERLMAARGYEPSDVAYVGNDVNDRECLSHVGVPICVADAHPDVRPLAKLITRRRGGRGAVREICDVIIRAKNGGWRA